MHSASTPRAEPTILHAYVDPYRCQAKYRREFSGNWLHARLARLRFALDRLFGLDDHRPRAVNSGRQHGLSEVGCGASAHQYEPVFHDDGIEAAVLHHLTDQDLEPRARRPSVLYEGAGLPGFEHLDPTRR